MKKVKVSVRALFWAAGRPAGSVTEALEALRTLWKEDEGVKRLMTEAAEKGYILVDTRDIPPAFLAALRVALNRLRERIAPSPSPTLVRLEKGKEERKQPKPKEWTWVSPEGVPYKVYPYDLPLPKGSPYWAFRDTRVEDAMKWVNDFLSTGQEILGPSPWEEMLEYEDNPHFKRNLPADLEEELRLLGWKGELRELPALVNRIPTRERELAEAIRQVDTLVDNGQVVARRVPTGWEVRKASITQALLALEKALNRVEEGEWTTKEMKTLVAQFAPFTPSGAKITRLVEEIATLRRLGKYLDDLMKPPVRAVAYHGPTGEVVLTVNAYEG